MWNVCVVETGVGGQVMGVWKDRCDDTDDVGRTGVREAIHRAPDRHCT